MEDSFVFEMLDSFDELGDRAPTQWVARYVPPPQTKPDLRHKDTARKSKNKNRIYRRKKRVDLFNNDTTDELNLPPFLRHYGVQIKNPWEFSGPSVLKEESDEGCVEYKLRLSRGNPTRFEQLVTQLKFRIAEGGGQCFYCLGVEDNGYPAGLDSSALAESIATLEAMAAEVEATATVIRTPPGTEGRHCAFICVRRGAAGSVSDLAEVRIAVAGAVDGGKSTLISVLSLGKDGQPTLDNGRGAARMAILRHKHEIESGRTSSVSHRILAYSPTGAVLNYSRIAQFTPCELAASAGKFVRFSDLGGHQRYSKTSLRGLTSTRPDYTMLCICASQGICWVTLDHLAVSLALRVPVFVVVTKVDAVQRISEHNNGNDSVATQPMLPVFCVSCVTGARLPELHAFLNALPSSVSSASFPSSPSAAITCGVPGIQASTGDELISRISLSTFPSSSSPPPSPPISTHFQVDGAMDIAGVGPVFSGVVISGSISIGDELLVGPDDDGIFRNVLVSGLHRAQVAVETVWENQHATVAVTVARSCCQEDTREGASNSKSPALVREYEEGEEGEEEEEGQEIGMSASSSRSDIGAAAAAAAAAAAGVEEVVCCEGDRTVAAAAAFLPQKYKRQTSQTSQADIELLGKSWDFVRHLTPPGNPSFTPTHAAAAVAVAAAPSTGSSSADLNPSDDVDHVSVVPPLRPRKGTVLLGCSSGTRNRNTHAAAKGSTMSDIAVGDVSGWFYFEAVVAMIDESGNVWPGQKEEEKEKQEDKSLALALVNRAQEEEAGSSCDQGLISSSEPTRSSSSSSSSHHRLHHRRVSSTRSRSQKQRDNNTRSAAAHQVMVHCGGVRQAAGMITVDYFKNVVADGVGGFHCDTLVENEWARTVAGAKAAAAVLQHTITTTKKNSSPPCGEENGIKTARVKFKFSHRPEWLLPGSRAIFRNKSSGKVVGAGLILTGQKD
ncbi:putative GTP-binding protein 2 [Nannochloris sp. 'desiccata']|nr:hypothetical protein KSW81_001230 [Chlorella desiccata (nom. nud.)]KAH7617648.1 putative GTP-binding protein 2 [Chlorella desiccata (nom. nud.)]